MRFIEVKQIEIRNITQFLIENKVILHPKISPRGIPDFSGYEGKKFILILDRNILVRILRLVNEGELKDKHSLKIVSSLLFWSDFNNIALTSGLALTEYSHYHGGNAESSAENNIFLEIHKQYTPKHWLDLATGKTNTIPKIIPNKKESFSFFTEDDHFKMHYLEMLKLSQLYFDNTFPVDNKLIIFRQWVFENILICKYTTYFAVILLSNNSKIFKRIQINIDQIKEKCRNVAWDLTYLSFWSTQYSFENLAKEIYLFATMDKELKSLFYLTHEESNEIYFKIFGEHIGGDIIIKLSEIYSPRAKPEIDQNKLDEMIKNEEEYLKAVLVKKRNSPQ